MKRKAVTALAAIYVLSNVTGCASLDMLDQKVFKIQDEILETVEDSSREEKLNKMVKERDKPEDVSLKEAKKYLDENLTRFQNADSMFIRLQCEKNGLEQTILSLVSQETIISAVRQENASLVSYGMILYRHMEDDWIIAAANKGESEDKAQVTSLNDQMESIGYKKKAADLTGFEVLTYSICDANVINVKKTKNGYCVDGTMAMIGAKAEFYFNEDWQLSNMKYKKGEEYGEYIFYGEDGPNENKAQEIADDFVNIASSADNFITDMVKTMAGIDRAETEGSDYEEKLFETETAAKEQLENNNESSATAASERSGWKHDETVQNVIAEIQKKIGMTVLDAPFGRSWLNLEDPQHRYDSGESVWVKSSFTIYKTMEDGSLEKQDAYVMVKLENQTNEEQIYTQMTIMDVSVPD